MANKALASTVTEVRIRAAVSVVAPVASASVQRISASAAVVDSRQAGVSLQKLASAVQYVIPAVALNYVSIVLGVVIDPIGRNPFVYDYGVSTDSAVFSIGKALSDLAQTSEAKTIVFGKSLADTAVSSEAKQFAMSKPLVDTKASSDSAAKGFTKAPIAESLTKSDSATVQAEKHIEDIAFNLEGPMVVQDYADPTYFAGNYVLNGGPIFAFDKVLSELLDATDDFQGAANIDDDQVMLFTKTLADSALSSETVAKCFSRGLTDSASKSDSSSLEVGKSFAEVLAGSEIVVRGVAKQVSDTAASSDSASRSFDKALSDTPVTGDLKTFSLAKVAVDSASTTDSAVRSFSKATTDAITKADSASIGAGKAVTDTVSKSDSGDLRMTDYADITYFAQNYVGTSVTF